jgi:hypothetical protein
MKCRLLRLPFMTARIAARLDEGLVNRPLAVRQVAHARNTADGAEPEDWFGGWMVLPVPVDVLQARRPAGSACSATQAIGPSSVGEWP